MAASTSSSGEGQGFAHGCRPWTGETPGCDGAPQRGTWLWLDDRCATTERGPMAAFDYDVIVVGSGFGGSVAALRAAEKGYRVGVMESGRRWPDEDIPKTQWDLPHFLWFPAAELYGLQRIEYLDDVLILCGAGVGGGSHVYANTLYVPPRQFFDAPEWAGITDWADELAPHIDQASRMLGVVRYPYMPTDVDRVMREVA